MIDQFRGPYEFLSNFSKSPITVDGIDYMTVEHAYQAHKTLDPAKRKHISLLPSPGSAKRAGQGVTLRPDWETVKIEVMARLLLLKFQDDALRAKLLATGDHELVEGNHWHDTFWGVCNGKGENWLGRLLMGIRKQLRGDNDCTNAEMRPE